MSSENPTVMDGFPQFSLLPPELRMMIWEYTWPEPRIIEATCWQGLEEPVDERGPEIVSLRLMCYLPTWIDFCMAKYYRVFEQEVPLEMCCDPVALRVCRESRGQALGRFVKMQHPKLPRRGFYLDPQKDILWISEDASDCPEKLSGLKPHYGQQLDRITNMVLEDSIWSDDSRAILDLMKTINSLSSVHIILDEDILEDDILEDEESEQDSDTDDLTDTQSVQSSSTTDTDKEHLEELQLQLRDRSRLSGQAWNVWYVNDVKKLNSLC